MYIDSMCVCMYVYKYVCMYVCMYISMYICMHYVMCVYPWPTSTHMLQMQVS